eukprot:COSAG01_NODE_7490_length_3187_cov_2.949482_5_plen_121_part_00
MKISPAHRAAVPSTEFQAHRHRGIAPNRAESCWIQGIGIDTKQSWLLALQASTGLASHRLTWHRIDTAQSQPAVPHCVQRCTEGHSALRQHSAPSRIAGTERHIVLEEVHDGGQQEAGNQ